MIILAIETSCDDTCIAILKISAKDKRKTKIRSLEILSNVVSSQVKLHAKYGGVYPFLAQREHQRNLAFILKQALLKARLLKSKIKYQKSKLPACQSLSLQAIAGRQIKNKKLKEILSREELLYQELEKFHRKYQKPKIDIIAVTIGPGLDPCLWVGVNFARALSYYWNLPLIPVNHIEAHILANWLTPISSKSKIPPSSAGRAPQGGDKNKKEPFGVSTTAKIKIKNKKIEFPAVCLVVSGGHTQLILMTPIRKASLSNGIKKSWKYKIIGETRDDAAGECFDKTARILGLGYPGGPIISRQAAKLKSKIKKNPSGCLRQQKSKIVLPRPMIHSKDYDFSFSGLKTAVLYKVKSEKRKAKSEKYKQAMCSEIQQAIIDVLIHKTLKAAKNYKAKTIILGGGVAANKELRKQFNEKIKKELPNIQYLTPNIQYCADNAAMIAVAAYFNRLKGPKSGRINIKAKPNLRV